MYTAKPTKAQAAWQDMELGVLIDYLMEIYRPDLCETVSPDWYHTDLVRTELSPDKIHPTKLEPEQWVKCAAEMGAKYAVLVANHCTGFSLWDTKADDFSIAHTDWRGGGGDVCREFIEACKKYNIRPGIYYSTGVAGYYNVNGCLRDRQSEGYRNFVKVVEQQVTELWSQYGELFEIWFDGGVVPVDQGGPNLTPLLEKYQPQAICFQGPKDFKNNVRWVGNELGLAPENCWATTNAGEPRYDGSQYDEPEGVGDPDGKYYWPAETDMPNRKAAAFGDGWAWKEGEEHLLYTPEELLDCYIRSVGRNSNMLLGMAISTDGDFKDEEQFRAFGKLIQETFGNPDVMVESPALDGDRVRLNLGEEKAIKYIVIREDITEGQRIRGFRILADGVPVYESECIGHKRIVPFHALKAKEITLEITRKADDVKIRDIAVHC